MDVCMGKHAFSCEDGHSLDIETSLADHHTTCGLVSTKSMEAFAVALHGKHNYTLNTSNIFCLWIMCTYFGYHPTNPGVSSQLLLIGTSWLIVEGEDADLYMLYIWIGSNKESMCVCVCVFLALKRLHIWPQNLTRPFSKAVGENCDLVWL